MYFLDPALDVLMIFAGAIALFMILRSWMTAEEQGKIMWYQRASLWQLVALTLCVLCLAIILGRYGIHSRGIAHSLLHKFSRVSGWGVGGRIGWFTIIFSFSQVVTFIPLIAIFRWFDRKPRLVNLAAVLLTMILLVPVMVFINDAVRFSWPLNVLGRMAVHAFPRMFLLSLEVTLPSVLFIFLIYLFCAGYTSLRNHIIAAVKPARAYND